MTDRFSGLKFLVFAVLCTVISIGIAAVIGNWRFGDSLDYEAEFTTAQGLLVNDAVKISGVTVGKVTEIQATEEGTARVLFEVDEEYVVTDDSTVNIRWRDVFGLRFLYVDPGDGTRAENGTAFGTDKTTNAADLTVLLDRIVPVMTALDPQLQNEVLEALAEGLVGRDDEVQGLIRDGAALTEAIASRDTEIDSLIRDTTTIVEAYGQRRDDLQSLLGSFADVAESLASRNDLLSSSVIQVANAQEDLDRLLKANDANLRSALDEAETIVSVIAARTPELEKIMEEGGAGLVAYHRISRLGQWFNISAVGVSVDYQTVTARDGAQLPPQEAGGGPASLSSFFQTGS